MNNHIFFHHTLLIRAHREPRTKSTPLHLYIIIIIIPWFQAASFWLGHTHWKFLRALTLESFSCLNQQPIYWQSLRVSLFALPEMPDGERLEMRAAWEWHDISFDQILSLSVLFEQRNVKIIWHLYVYLSIIIKASRIQTLIVYTTTADFIFFLCTILPSVCKQCHSQSP